MKFLRFLGHLVAILLMTAALAVALMPAMYYFSSLLDGVEAVKDFAGDYLTNYWILFGVAAFAGLITAIIMRAIRIKKLKIVWAAVFGAALLGGLWAVSQYAIPDTVTVALLPPEAPDALTNAVWGISGFWTYVIVVGLFAVSITLSAILRKTKKKREPKVRAVLDAGRPSISSNSSNPSQQAYNDSAAEPSAPPRQTQPQERYVRDPWGNLIKEDDYNKRMEDVRNKKV